MHPKKSIKLEIKTKQRNENSKFLSEETLVEIGNKITGTPTTKTYIKQILDGDVNTNLLLQLVQLLFSLRKYNFIFVHSYVNGNVI